MVTHVKYTYEEVEFLIGDRVIFEKLAGDGVKGDPFRKESAVGAVAVVWRSKRLGRQRIIAIDLDGGGRLLVLEYFVRHEKKKPPRVKSIQVREG